MTQTEARSWQQGRDGEDIFAVALHKAKKAGLIPLTTVWFRNVRFGDGPGDIDFLVIGPTGAFVFDVKNWSEHSRMWADAERAATVSILEAEFVYSRIGDALDDLGVDLQLAWVMVGASQSDRYPSHIEVPLLTPAEAIEAIQGGGPLMTTNQATALARYASDSFTLTTKPEARV